MTKFIYTSYKYPLKVHNDSVLKDLSDEEVQEISDKRFEKNIKIFDTKKDDLKTIYRGLKNIAEFGFEYENREGCVYVSGYYLLISQLVGALGRHKRSENISLNLIVKLLFGEMSQHFEVSSPNGVRLFNTLDYESALHPHQPFVLAHYRTILVAYHLTSAKRKKKSDRELEQEAMQIINSGKGELKSEHIMQFYNSSYASDEYLKFDKKGMEFVKYGFEENPEIYEGFKEIRVHRKTKLNVKLLYAVIASLYLGEELYLHIDPYYFSAEISTKESLKLNGITPQIIVNFTNISKIVFDSYQEVGTDNFKREDTDKSKNPLKSLFDEVYKQVSDINPDKLKISINGGLNDVSKLMQVKKKVPFGEVGTQQHGGKSSEVKFHIEKDLKGFKKKLKRK